jgi:hypothetical protein
MDEIELQELQNGSNPMLKSSMDTIMNMSASALIAGLVFSVIGIWMFKRGRIKNNMTLVLISIVLMAYPMFTKNPWQDWGIGIALCAYAKYRWD